MPEWPWKWCLSLLSWTLWDQFSEGGIGFKYVRDLHSDLSSAMARHSSKLTNSPLHFRAFFDVRPHVISGYLFGLECATQPVSNCRGARVVGIRPTWPETDCGSSYLNTLSLWKRVADLMWWWNAWWRLARHMLRTQRLWKHRSRLNKSSRKHQTSHP